MHHSDDKIDKGFIKSALLFFTPILNASPTIFIALHPDSFTAFNHPEEIQVKFKRNECNDYSIYYQFVSIYINRDR